MKKLTLGSLILVLGSSLTAQGWVWGDNDAVEQVNSGAMKNCAKRSTAPSKASCLISKM